MGGGEKGRVEQIGSFLAKGKVERERSFAPSEGVIRTAKEAPQGAGPGQKKTLLEEQREKTISRGRKGIQKAKEKKRC